MKRKCWRYRTTRASHPLRWVSPRHFDPRTIISVLRVWKKVMTPGTWTSKMTMTTLMRSSSTKLFKWKRKGRSMTILSYDVTVITISPRSQSRAQALLSIQPQTPRVGRWRKSLLITMCIEDHWLPLRSKVSTIRTKISDQSTIKASIAVLWPRVRWIYKDTKRL